MAGAAIRPISVSNVTMDSSVVNAALASSQVSFLLRRVWYSVKTGDKGRGHGPFGQEFAQQIRNPIGHEKRIGRNRRTQESREQYVAHQSQDAAGKGGCADESRDPHDGGVLVGVRRSDFR